MSGDELLDWPERGQRLTIGRTIDRAVVVTVADDDGQATIELSSEAVRALTATVDEISEGRGWIPEVVHEAILEELGSAQEQLDRANERVDQLEAELRQRLTEIEQHKSAGEIADRRARALERDLERMRAASHAASCACSTCSSIGARS